MTAALYHLPAGSLETAAAGDVVVLDGDEGHHAVTVKRVRAGEPVLLADGSGRIAQGRVVSTGTGTASVEVLSVDEARTSGPRFVLVQALAKAGRDEQAVEAATELGVDGVLAWQADRCIVRWRAEKAAKALEKWRSVVTAAAKQSRRPVVPAVDGPLTTSDLVLHAGRAAATLVLHEDATSPLAGFELPPEGDVLVVIGPEGGIAPDEITRLEQAGAHQVRLGPTVLRSSSAGPAALAVLNAAGRWR